MAELKINKEWVKDAVQPVIEDVKANYIHKSVIKNIRADIAEVLANAAKESKQTQDDVDLGITIGLQMALDTVNKHCGKEKENATEKS